jgi:hypothetical protein
MTVDEQITELENAIATGSRRVKYDDKEIEYRSHKELIQALEYLKAKKNGSRNVLRGINPIYKKGYE